MKFTAAVRAYRAAKALECVELLDGSTESHAVILRARAFHRLYDPIRGIASLVDVDPRGIEATAQRAEYHIVLAALEILSGDLLRASETLDRANELIVHSSSHAAEAEYHVVRSILAFSSSDLNEADRAAQNALHANLTLDTGVARYFEDFATSKARALNMRGLVCAGRQSYHEQGRFLRLAIVELQRQTDPDLWMLANLLMHLAFHSRDFHSDVDVKIVEDGLRKADWPHELDRAKSEMHASLGRSYALGGRFDEAHRSFERAVDLAPARGWKVVAGSLLAAFELEIGDRAAAAKTIRVATALIADAQISEFTEERYALLDLAWVTASVDAAAARTLLDRYRALSQPLSPVFNTSTDKRPKAYELRTEAVVLRAEGNTDRAIERFREAFEIWYEIGLEWLAATVAFELLSLTNEIRFRTYLRRETSLRPASALAKQFATFESCA